MNNKTILVIGSLNMDLVARTQRLPQKGETVFGNSFATFPGGKGANQAVAAAKLGTTVHMIGCVGKDGFGQELVLGMDTVGINTQGIRSVEEATGTALITVEEQGSNTIVVVSGANGLCGRKDVDQGLSGLSPGILLLQHEIPEDTVNYAICQAKKAGWVIILNPAPARAIPEDVLKKVDILTPNESEAALLTGIDVRDIDDAKQAGRNLLQRGVGSVIITLGDKGALMCTAQKFLEIPPIKVQAVDTTAAGDAFTGALATALAEAKSLSTSIQFATAAAAISVMRSGAQPALASREEVEKFLMQQGRA